MRYQFGIIRYRLSAVSCERREINIFIKQKHTSNNDRNCRCIISFFSRIVRAFEDYNKAPRARREVDPRLLCRHGERIYYFKVREKKLKMQIISIYLYDWRHVVLIDRASPYDFVQMFAKNIRRNENLWKKTKPVVMHNTWCRCAQQISIDWRKTVEQLCWLLRTLRHQNMKVVFLFLIYKINIGLSKKKNISTIFKNYLFRQLS